MESNGAYAYLRLIRRRRLYWLSVQCPVDETDRFLVAVSETVPRLETHAQVYIKVLDINDNAPELDIPSEPQVCENAAVGEVIYQRQNVH